MAGEYNPKQLVKLVITRSVRSKETEESKLTQFHPGQKVTMQRKYADELVSIRKAVVEGSPEHEAWTKRQAELKISKPSLAAVQADNQKLAAENAELKAKLEKLEAEAKDKKGNK